MRQWVLVVFALVALASAEPVGRTVGIGTRAYGMADNFTALSNDYSAVFWNPAGMAFVPVREFHCAMDYNRQDQETDYGGYTTSSQMQRFRLNSFGLLRSVPTVRGGFALALGYSSPWLLDGVNNATGNDIYRGRDTLYGETGTVAAGDHLFIDKSNHVARGQLSLWNAGAGWQIAPGLGFGISVGLLTGSEVEKIELVKSFNNNEFENVVATAERSYLSSDARLGFLYMPRKEISIGCRLELPRQWSMVAENYNEDNSAYGIAKITSYGKLQSPFSGAIGAALQLPFLTISSDMTFRAPLAGSVPSGSDLAYWKEGIGLGFEVPAKWLAGVIRGGYSYSQFDPASMQIKWEDPSIDTGVTVTGLHGHQLLSVGYSLFAGNSVSFDVAYGYVISEFSMKYTDWENIQTEKNTYQRGMVSLSIRY
jgi:hypothetical protein